MAFSCDVAMDPVSAFTYTNFKSMVSSYRLIADCTADSAKIEILLIKAQIGVKIEDSEKILSDFVCWYMGQSRADAHSSCSRSIYRKRLYRVYRKIAAPLRFYHPARRYSHICVLQLLKTFSVRAVRPYSWLLTDIFSILRTL